MKTALYVNWSTDSDESIKLLKEAGIKFRIVPANGPLMPVLIVGGGVGSEFQGLEQIRLYLRLLRLHKETENAKGI